MDAPTTIPGDNARAASGATPLARQRESFSPAVNLTPFVPPRWAQGGHAQTLLGHLLPSPRLPGWGPHSGSLGKPARDKDKSERIDEPWRITLPDGDQLAAYYFEGRLPVVIYFFHGLSGESHGSYMQRSALVALDLGFSAVVCNHRGCGEGAGLARASYHSGRSDDMGAVIAAGRKRLPGHRHIAVGFSMSGNIVLLLAAAQRLGPCLDPSEALPDAALSVNAPLDLARASKRLKRGFNRLYDGNFMRVLRAEVRARQKAGLPLPPSARKVGWLSSCWDFDEYYTAPAMGFRDRADYYAACSAFPHLREIRIPTAILTAADDPFVPVESYERAELSPLAHMRIEAHGGHLGYLSALPTPLGTYRWLDWAIREYLQALASATAQGARNS